MGLYPGLGLPLRHWPQESNINEHVSYPHGAHPNVIGSESDLLPVREVCMMGVMDKITDKKDWHKKVFDETICEKWREEAMSIPDRDIMAAAAAPQSSWDQEHLARMSMDPDARIEAPTTVKGIMSKVAFDYVGSPSHLGTPSVDWLGASD